MAPPKPTKKNPVRKRTKPKAADEAAPPPSPQRKRKQANKKKSGEESDSESEAENRIDWTDELCLLMITEITNSETIRQGLFPGPGTKAAPSNKAGKNEYRWDLCVAVFSDHPDYREVFAEVAVNTERKKSWILKMKNKLAAMTTKVKGYMKEMGQTGAGINSKEDIDMTKTGPKLNRWLEISAECAYFFELKSLIAGRPSVVATGLGNNDNEIDMSLLLDPYHLSESSGTEGDLFQPGQEGSGGDDDDEGIGGLGRAEEPESDGGDEADSASDDLATILSVPAKRKAAENFENKKPTKKTAPRSGKSAPAPAPIKPKKSTSTMDRFATVATAEEVTVQKKIELKRARIIGEKEVEIESTKAKASVQIRKEELKAQYAIEKLRLEHDMRLAELQARNHASVDRFQTFHNPSVLSHSTPFMSTSHSSPAPLTSGFLQHQLSTAQFPNDEAKQPAPPVSLDGDMNIFSFVPSSDQAQ